jgi:hypothetical protein
MTRFTASLVLTCALVGALAAAFAVYVVQENKVDRAGALRFASLRLASGLRRSSNDLSRMATTYVVTGDPAFKKSYRDILDERDGKRPSDFIAPAGETPAADGRRVPLLATARNLGFTEEESRKLREAKANSDLLVDTEEQAIRLAETTGPGAGEDRALAIAMLHDEKYQRARAAILAPIDEFGRLTQERTREAVRAARDTAGLARYAFIVIGICLVAMLLRTYLILRGTMGGSLDEVHAEIVALGNGDFSRSAPLGNGLRGSVR